MDDHAGNGDGKRVVLLVATIASFIFPFMASTVNIALPSLGKELSLDAVTLGWIATAYLLSSAALLVPFGRIADIYGRKKIFTCGIGIFTFSSLLSGLANSATMLIAWRVLQGIGGAMLAGTAVALLTTVFPAKERGKVLGIIVAAAYLGLSLGPVLGGVLTQHLGWRSIFFLGAILGSLVLAVVLWKLKGEWTGAKGERFDVAGSVIYVLGLVALVYGFTLLPAMSGAGLIIGGAIGLSAFVRWETRTRSPVLDICLLYTSDAADDTPCVDLGACVEAEVIDYNVVTCHEAADGGERLRKRARDQIDFVRETPVCSRSLAVRSQDPERVRIIDQQCGIVFLGQRDEIGEIDDVAFHAVHTIDDHQLATIRIRGLQQVLQLTIVLVPEALRLAEAETRTVLETGMAILVQKDRVAASDRRADRAEIRLVTRTEYEGRFFSREVGQLFLEQIVNVEVSVQEAASGVAATVDLQRLSCCLQDQWVVGQPHVVVGADHHFPLAVDDDLGVP